MQICSILAMWFAFRTVYGAPDNAGTEFYIGFMENMKHRHDIDNHLFITTHCNKVVNVTVSAPRATGLVLHEETTVIAGQVRKITIPRRFEHRGTELQSKGILVSASDEVVIYGINTQSYSTDGFLGIPSDVLDKEYIAACYSPASRYTLILIVGVEDGSNVTILLPGNDDVEIDFMNNKYRNYDRINVTMYRFETFQISSKGDMTGTRIMSDKIIAVFSGNKKTYIETQKSQDHLVEQLFPVSTWGKSFATVPIPGIYYGDKFRFITSESNTNIVLHFFVNKTLRTEHFVIQSANSYAEKEFQSNWFVHVESDKPILLAQFVKSQGFGSDPSDPSMILIPTIQQYASDYTFTTPQYSSDVFFNYVMFVVPKSAKDGLLLNNNHLPNGIVYHDIPNTLPPLVGGSVQIPAGTYTFRHSSPITKFGAILFGRKKMESYGFPIGTRFAPINKLCLPTPVIIGDGFDNDCDGRIDEERCFPFSTDDDRDGKTNEDRAKSSTDNAPWSLSLETTSNSLRGSTGGRDESSQEGVTSAVFAVTNNPGKESNYDSSQEMSATSEVTNDPDTTTVTKHYSSTFAADKARNRDIYKEYADTASATFPSWFRYLEIAVLTLITVIFSGGCLCLCKHCCASSKRITDDEDETRTRKYRRLRRSMKSKPTSRSPIWSLS